VVADGRPHCNKLLRLEKHAGTLDSLLKLQKVHNHAMSSTPVTRAIQNECRNFGGPRHKSTSARCLHGGPVKTWELRRFLDPNKLHGQPMTTLVGRHTARPGRGKSDRRSRDGTGDGAATPMLLGNLPSPRTSRLPLRRSRLSDLAFGEPSSPHPVPRKTVTKFGIEMRLW
jgi:hypothetical protein